MGTRTVEDYVVDIMKDIDDAAFTSLSEACETLDRMSYSNKKKYHHNFWKVMQCLGEMASDRLVQFVGKMEKHSCKCHYRRNLKCVLNLLDDVMSNVKVVKRINTKIPELRTILLKSFRQSDDHSLSHTALSIIHKLFIVGRSDTINFFVCHNLITDMLQRIKASVLVSKISYERLSEATKITQILVVILICGSEIAKTQVKRSGMKQQLEYMIVKLVAKEDHSFQLSQRMYAEFKVLDSVMTDEEKADAERKSWNMKLKLHHTLNRTEDERGPLLFCSAPACRKESEHFRYCGACRLARYCSEVCQREHWKNGHREACQGEP